MVVNFVAPSAKIGTGVKIWHFAYIGNDVVLGDNAMVGSLAHIDYGAAIGKNTRIQGNAYISHLSKIGDGVFIGPGAIFTNDPYPPSGKLKGITVCDGAIIGAGAKLMTGITIGKRSVVGMGSTVTRNVPDEVVVMGSPATIRYTRAEYDRKQEEWQKR